MMNKREAIKRLHVNPLDILTLCEAYGNMALAQKPRPNDENCLFVLYAKMAFHHAMTFTHLDDSYEKVEWL